MQENNWTKKVRILNACSATINHNIAIIAIVMNIIFHIFSVKVTIMIPISTLLNVIKIMIMDQDGGGTSSVREIDHCDGRPDDTSADGACRDDEDDVEDDDGQDDYAQDDEDDDDNNDEKGEIS